MAVLSASAIQEKLKSLPEWKLEGGEIVRLYTFTDFLRFSPICKSCRQRSRRYRASSRHRHSV